MILVQAYSVEKTQNIEIREEDIRIAIGALYPFQYEAFRHPIRFVGKCLIHTDDYLTYLFTRKKGTDNTMVALALKLLVLDPYQIVDKRKQVPLLQPIPFKRQKIGT